MINPLVLRQWPSMPVQQLSIDLGASCNKPIRPRSAYLKSRLVRFLFLAGTVFFSHNNSALACFLANFSQANGDVVFNTCLFNKTSYGTVNYTSKINTTKVSGDNWRKKVPLNNLNQFTVFQPSRLLAMSQQELVFVSGKCQLARKGRSEEYQCHTQIPLSKLKSEINRGSTTIHKENYVKTILNSEPVSQLFTSIYIDCTSVHPKLNKSQ